MSENKRNTVTFNDPYVYPGTQVLINKFGVKEQGQLQEIESIIFALQNAQPFPSGSYDFTHLKAVHKHFFEKIYTWAGDVRTIDLAKGDSYFANHNYIDQSANKIFSQLAKENYLIGLNKAEFCERLSHYFNEINAIHPFREGNGRVQRTFCKLIAEQAGHEISWCLADEKEYMQASISGFLQADYQLMANLFHKIILPFGRTQEIAQSEWGLSINLIEKIKTYAEKQVKLTEVASQKNQLVITDYQSSKDFFQKAKTLSNELKALAEEIVADAATQKILSNTTACPLHKHGGFALIYENFRANKFSQLEILAVLQYARNAIQPSSLHLLQQKARNVQR